MAAVDIIVSLPARRWQALIAERLAARGHDVSVIATHKAGADLPASARLILALEPMIHPSRRPALMDRVDLAPRHTHRMPALTLDLTGRASAPGPVLRLSFDGGPSPVAALATLARGGLPEIALARDGEVIARASPMIDNPYFIFLALEDVLARAMTLVEATVAREASGAARPVAALAAASERQGGLLRDYLGKALPRLAREAWRRSRFRDAHWRVGYRFAAPASVVESGRLGDGWAVLPDDGSRFYADPFPFEHGGRTFVFLEDYPHSTRKAVISVSELKRGGQASRPRPVLEEPWHLSYPQVFRRDGEIWMIPESSAGHRVSLYRARAFPDHWARHADLIVGRELSDATLFEHDGRLWLFATERDGYGSTSDTLVVFSAESLTGPWKPHPANPVLIDRRRARPGGALLRNGSRVLLPVQDGTQGYGGGLGFAELLELSPEVVRLGEPGPIDVAGDWPYPRIHTYNRLGDLEVVDGIAAVRK